MRFQPDPKKVRPGAAVKSAMAPGWKFDKILPEITRRTVRYIHAQAATEKPFFLYYSMTSPHGPIAPSKQFVGKSGIAPIVDFLMQTDWSVGQVLKAIDDAGIRDNTIVIFAGDNGPVTISDRDQINKAGIKRSGPYRGEKGDIWEGGHREPFIVRWPGHVQAGSASDQLVCLNDLFATCADIVGAQLPENAAEDSISFLPALDAKSQGSLRSSLVNHSGRGEFAYREKNWKLVFKFPEGESASSREKSTAVELYDLQDDIAEKHDLASQHPELVRQLTAKLQATIDDGRSRLGRAKPTTGKCALMRFRPSAGRRH